MLNVVMNRTDTDFNSDGVGDNVANCPALVRHGRAEWYDDIDLNSGRGGYIESNGEWVECETVPGVYKKIEKSLFSSGPNYTVDEKCYPVIRLPLHNYLLGIAEVHRDWHLEAWKALTLTHRFTAIQHSNGAGFIKNDGVQVFQCNEVFNNIGTGSTTNEAVAVELTRDEFAYKKSDNELANATARSAFCGPGSTNPKFDGWKYENISYVVDSLGESKMVNTNNNIGGMCFEGVGYTFANQDIGPSGVEPYIIPTGSPGSYTFTYNENNPKPAISCGGFTPEDRTRLEASLQQAVSAVGWGTRAGVVEAARFLIGGLNFQVPYQGPKSGNPEIGRYEKVGLNIGNDKAWGCSVSGYTQGMDCTNFVYWALINGGLSRNIVRPQSSAVSLRDNVDRVGVGDFLLTLSNGSVSWTYSHTAMIIGEDDSYFYVAESKGTGTRMIKLAKASLPSKNQEYGMVSIGQYPSEGKVTNMWN